MAIDQFVQAPIFTVLIFLFLGLLEGKSLERIKLQLDETYVDTMVANWKLWIPATAVNLGAAGGGTGRGGGNSDNLPSLSYPSIFSNFSPPPFALQPFVPTCSVSFS